MKTMRILLKKTIQLSIILTVHLTMIPEAIAQRGGAGDGGGTGCRKLIMQAAVEASQTVEESKNNLEIPLTGFQFLSYINANDIVAIPVNEDTYTVTYSENKYKVQCQAIANSGADELTISLVAKAIFTKIKERTQVDYISQMEAMFFHSIPTYLNPEKDAYNLAIEQGFNLKSNSCELIVPGGQGAKGNLEISIREFQNANGRKITTGYYIINEAVNIKYDTIDIEQISISNMLKSRNKISDLLLDGYESDNEKLHHFKINKLKINKRTHTYLIDKDITLECENPIQ